MTANIECSSNSVLEIKQDIKIKSILFLSRILKYQITFYNVTKSSLLKMEKVIPTKRSDI